MYHGFNILESGAENISFFCVYEVGLSNNNLNVSINTVKNIKDLVSC